MLAKRLKTGNSIGVLSPSNPVDLSKWDEQLENGIKFLEGFGFRAVKSKNIGSADPREKAEDINSFFSDKKISAIICTQGGDSAEQVLPFLDWKTIKRNPKIFMGISDITILLNAIFRKTGLLTFHGNDIRFGFGRNPSDYDRQEFLDRLVMGKTGEIKQNRERKTIRSGKARGRLLGGNIRCLLKLAGSEYWPDFKDAVLALEAYKLDEKTCLKHFSSLKELGVFDLISAAVVGYIYGMQEESPQSRQMEEILLDFTKGNNFPILKANDFGHNCPNTVLPIGAKVELDADNKKIIILEECVE